MAAEIERRGAIRPISDLPAAAMVEGTDLVELEHAGHFYKVTASAFATAGLVATLTLGNYLSGGSYNGSVNVTTNVLATPLNTASYVVARDASGNFAAGDVTVAHLIAGTDPGGTDLVRVGGAATITGNLTLSASSVLAWSTDVKFYDGGAGKLRFINGVQANILEIYNTTDSNTSPANLERVSVGFSGNQAFFRTTQAGSGTARNLVLGTFGSATTFIGSNQASFAAWQFTTANNFVAGTDNAFDIGASGATRPRTLYLGTSIVIATDPGGTGLIRGQGTGQGSIIHASDSTTYAAIAFSAVGSTITAYVGADKAGTLGPTGTATGDLIFRSENKNQYWTVDAGNTAHLKLTSTLLTAKVGLVFSADNTLDIGASGATRPRTGYFGTSVVIATDPGGTNALRVGGSATLATGASGVRLTIGDATAAAEDSSVVLRQGSGRLAWLMGVSHTIVGWELTPSTAAGGTTFSVPRMWILDAGDVLFNSDQDASANVFAGRGGSAPTAVRTQQVIINAPSSVTNVGQAFVNFQRDGGSIIQVGLFRSVTGAMAANTDFSMSFAGASSAFAVTTAGQVRSASGFVTKAGAAGTFGSVDAFNVNFVSNNTTRGFIDNSTAALVWGTDPGGSTLLRVGGQSTLADTVFAGTSAATLATGPWVESGDGVIGQTKIKVIRAAAVPGFRAFRVNNTLASPTAIANNDSLGTLDIGGYDGSAISIGATVGAQATEAWAVGAHGTKLQFQATQATTTTLSALFYMTAGASISKLVSGQVTMHVVGGSTSGVIFRDSTDARSNFQVTDAGSAAILTDGTFNGRMSLNSTSGEMTGGVRFGGSQDTWLTSIAGTAGQLVGAAYFDGTQYRSLFEGANVGSGFTTFKLVRSGGVVVIGTDPGGTDTLRVGGATTTTTLTASTRVTSPLLGTTTAVDVVLDRNSVTQLTLASLTATFAGSIKTAAPSGGTAAFWKLGSYITAGVAFDNAHYIEVDIGGTLYKLGVVT